MKLFFREFGDSNLKPLVILHGLLGSSRNWQAAAAALGEHFHVFALDLRNHGESPHAFPHSYDAMLEDLEAFLDEQGLEKTTLIGHSMGGKVAMKFACSHSERVERLVVVDILPIHMGMTLRACNRWIWPRSKQGPRRREYSRNI